MFFAYYLACTALNDMIQFIRCIPKFTFFVLTGSSARKLKAGGANLLAGRAFVKKLYPFSFMELGADFNLE